MKIRLGFVTLSIPPTFHSDNADQSHYSGMQTRAQGGYVDPGWGEKAKTSPTDQNQGQDKETRCGTETTQKGKK